MKHVLLEVHLMESFWVVLSGTSAWLHLVDKRFKGWPTTSFFQKLSSRHNWMTSAVCLHHKSNLESVERSLFFIIRRRASCISWQSVNNVNTWLWKFSPAKEPICQLVKQKDHSNVQGMEGNDNNLFSHLKEANKGIMLGAWEKWAFFWHNVQAFQTFMVCHLLHAQLFSYHQDGASGEEAPQRWGV